MGGSRFWTLRICIAAVVLLFLRTDCAAQLPPASPLPSVNPGTPLAPLFPAPRPVIQNVSGLAIHRYIIVLNPNSTSNASLPAVIGSILPTDANPENVFSSHPPSPTVPPTANLPNAGVPQSIPTVLLPMAVGNNSLNGFTAFLTEDQLAAVRSNPNVEYVEEDGFFSLNPGELPATAGPGNFGAPANSAGNIGSVGGFGKPESLVTFGNATATVMSFSSPLYAWGLDRIDQRQLPLDGSYSPTVGNHGAGVNVYMIDTGCRTTHQELRGRASLIYTIFNNGLEDQHGHGTHTAGTLAGTNVGVANQAQINCLAVLDSTGTGTYSDVILAMQFVGANVQYPAIMSMSLGGSYSRSVNAATLVLIQAGVISISASGNSGSATACNADPTGVSPASTTNLIVAASSNRSDDFSQFDNFGSCITVIAPGESILSAWGSGDSIYAIASGTSMAAPHVAGVAALFLNQFPNSSHADVKKAIECSATSSVINNDPVVVSNRLLYANIGICSASSPSSSTATAIAGPGAPTVFGPPPPIPAMTSVSEGTADGEPSNSSSLTGVPELGSPAFNISIGDNAATAAAVASSNIAMLAMLSASLVAAFLA